MERPGTADPPSPSRSGTRAPAFTSAARPGANVPDVVISVDMTTTGSRSSTAGRGPDQLLRRSSGGLVGRADLPGAPSTAYRHADPAKQPVRARSHAASMIEIQRVFEANFCVDGVRRIGRQLAREGIVTARCTVVRLVPRSDRGSHYLALRYTERLAGAGIEPSIGSVVDNALSETINGQFKVEAIHRRGPWRSLQAVEYATSEWVDWYNHRRLLAPISNVPPAEAEAHYHAHVGDQAWAA
ncbi:transposase [Methylobacterium aquaticum]|nr:transposase [Methylobacterium aquaticum]